MRGIILAGGTGTRLHPVTRGISKQLVPVYDKPMIYYPLSTLLLAGITEILIIVTPAEKNRFENLLGDGSQLGITITYATQQSPRGLADAFIIGADHIADQKVALILGDNIFYGPGLGNQLARFAHGPDATIFAYWVNNPHSYGVVSVTKDGKAYAISEKPQHTTSHYAVPGLYFYPPEVTELAKNLSPSPRGELEITDINQHYLAANKLHVEILPRGTAWLDTGNPDDLLDAANFVRTIEQRQGLKVGAIEEIAWRLKLIDAEQLHALGTAQEKSTYGQYLLNLLKFEE